MFLSVRFGQVMMREPSLPINLFWRAAAESTTHQSAVKTRARSTCNTLTDRLPWFQFNSMVLYCVPKLRLIGQKFSVREKMDIAGLQVCVSSLPLF